MNSILTKEEGAERLFFMSEFQDLSSQAVLPIHSSDKVKPCVVGFPEDCPSCPGNVDTVMGAAGKSLGKRGLLYLVK